jgi:hypothetical protein
MIRVSREMANGLIFVRRTQAGSTGTTATPQF